MLPEWEVGCRSNVTWCTGAVQDPPPSPLMQVHEIQSGRFHAICAGRAFYFHNIKVDHLVLQELLAHCQPR